MKLLFITEMLTSCQGDFFDSIGGRDEMAEYLKVDKALWPHFKKFEQEAGLRGINTDLADAVITGFISDIKTDHVLGQCSYNSQDPNRVTIDKPFWDKASDLAREFVVFHELGHCYLGRSHDESVDSRRVCKSIMRSGTGSCRDNYTAVTRSAYLDELFLERK